MKKTFSIACIVIVISILLLALTSCGVLNHLGLSNPLLRRITRYNASEEALAKKLCTAIQNQDAEALRELFSQSVADRLPGLSDDIERLLSLCGNDLLTVESHMLSESGSIEAGERVMNSNYLATVTTSDTEYYLHLTMCVEDTMNSENEGIKRIFVYTPEQEDYITYPYTSGDEGICFFSLDEPWYNSNDLQSRPLQMGDDLVDLNPPILLSKGSLLFPLFSLLDALGATYSQNEADGSIDLVHENKHFRITFPEADNENYQWIALTDLDLERELRLSNSEKYCGLYTVIDGTIYLHQKSGEYLFTHLGYEHYRIKDNIYFVRPKNNANSKDQS